MRARPVITAGVLLIGAASVAVASADPGPGLIPQPTHTFGPVHFAAALSSSADGTVVAAGDDNPGIVHVFQRIGNAWAPAPAPTGFQSDEILAAYLSGNGNELAVVAAGVNRGYVTVWGRTLTGWVEQAKIDGPLHENAFFQDAVSLNADGTKLLVAHVGSPTTGWAQVYERRGSTWTVHKKFTAPDAATGNQWLWPENAALSADGDTVALSAVNGEAPGSLVTTYNERHDWAAVSVPNDGGPDERLALDANGDEVAVTKIGAVASSVSVYKLRSGAWKRVASLAAAHPQSAAFGNRLALSASGDTVIATDSDWSDPSHTHGKPYGAAFRFVFANGKWNFGGLLRNTDPGTLGLGMGLAISADASKIFVSDYVTATAIPHVVEFETPPTGP